ncbi:MAG: hypothetical protein J6S14_17275 [Clostridia bacterium]|nr:hypothetical protein [Clostridia bacterium]
MSANEKFGMKEVLNVVLYDMETGKPVIQFDSLKNSSINVTAEKVHARGGWGNPKLVTWEFNKEATMTVEDALLSPKSFELVSGLATSTGAQEIPMRQTNEYESVANGGVKNKGDIYPLKVKEGKITLAYEPADAAKLFVYEYADDCGTPLEVSVSGKEVTLTGVEDGTRVVAYYDFLSSASTKTFTIDANTFSGTYKLMGDTVVRNKETGKDEAFKVVIPNIKWSSAFSFNLTADGEPATQSFECDIMKPSDSSIMIQMYKYNEEIA